VINDPPLYLLQCSLANSCHEKKKNIGVVSQQKKKRETECISHPAVGESDVLETEGRVPRVLADDQPCCWPILIVDERQHRRLVDVLPARQRGGEVAVPHEEVQRDWLERVAVQRQLLAERHRVEALDLAAGGHHPRQHLLAADARQHEHPGRPPRGAVQLQEPRQRRRHAGGALLRHRRHVDEPFLGAADGEAQARVARSEPQLQRRLAGRRRVPQPHRPHHADVHAVVVLESVQARVGHDGQVRQRAHVHGRQRHLAGDLGQQRLRLHVHEQDGHAGGLRRQQPRVGAGQGVLQRIVPPVGRVTRLGQQKHGQEAARIRHREQLPRLLPPREGLVRVPNLGVAQRRQ
jgi:hypothetical protein